MKNKILSVREILLFYFKIGFFTFGGGWSIIAQMKKEFVEKRGILSEEELADFTSMGRSLPGTMIGNVSFLFGYHTGGTLGGFAALVGIAFWPFVILGVITMVYGTILNEPLVTWAMAGVRAAVVPVMFSAMTALWKQSLQDRFCYGMMLLSFMLGYLGVGNIPLVLAGGVAGALVKGMTEHENTV